MGIFNWFNRSALRSDFTTNVLPPPRPTYDINKQALAISSVYRAVSVLSTSVSQLSGSAYKGDDQIDKPTWMYRPDPELTGSAFTELTVTSLALHGNAFWRVYRNGRNEPIALKLLNPNDVAIDTINGKTVYRFDGAVYDRTQIKHLALLRVPGFDRGVGPIQASRYALEGMLALQDYQNEWFLGKGIPQGILKTDQPLSKDLADEYEARWNEKLQAAANNDQAPVAVLGSGVDYKPILINPKDAMYIDVANFSVAEVARLFGMPPHQLGVGLEGSSLTYNTSADMDIQFLRYTLSQYVVEIEEAVSELLPRGTHYKFDTTSLLRTNDKARYEAYEIGLRAGWLTREEVRQYEGLPKLSGNAIEAAPANNLTNEEGA